MSSDRDTPIHCPDCGGDSASYRVHAYVTESYTCGTIGDLYDGGYGEPDEYEVQDRDHDAATVRCDACGFESEDFEDFAAELCGDCGEPIEVEGDQGLCTECTDDRDEGAQSPGLRGPAFRVRGAV